MNSFETDRRLSQKVTAFVSHEDSPRHDTGWNHPDHQGRLPAAARAVYRDMLTLFEPMLELSATPAGDDDLALVHTERYIRAVGDIVAQAAAENRVLELDGVRVSAATGEAARAAAGGALTAIDAVLRGEVRNGFVLARPPGHDALPDRASGFSIFNTVAIAARHLRQRRDVEHVLVVSWGDRPATHLRQALETTDGVRVISIHAHPQSFPEPATDPPPPAPGDVPLPPGSDGAAFTAALRIALAELPAGESPFILLAAGFDILAADPLGRLAVEVGEVHGLTVALREWADSRAAGRLVSVLEGGYDAPATAGAIVQHLRGLIGLPAA